MTSDIEAHSDDEVKTHEFKFNKKWLAKAPKRKKVGERMGRLFYGTLGGASCTLFAATALQNTVLKTWFNGLPEAAKCNLAGFSGAMLAWIASQDGCTELNLIHKALAVTIAGVVAGNCYFAVLNATAHRPSSLEQAVVYGMPAWFFLTVYEILYTYLIMPYVVQPGLTKLEHCYESIKEKLGSKNLEESTALRHKL